MTQLGDFIKNRREELEWSQLKLGKLAGISRATVSQIEAGFHTHPKPETLERLAKVLKVSYELLDRLSRGLADASDNSPQPPQALEVVAQAIYVQVHLLPIPQRERDNLATIFEKFLDRYK